MGGTPLTALNISCFPADVYPSEVLAEMIAGGMSVLQRAGVSLLGGHTIQDAELKFGVAVTGICHPDHVLTNQNAKPGDKLLLTKRIGTGVIATAVKRGLADSTITEAFISSMLQLSDKPITIAKELGIPDKVHAATDITGYGLLGHLSHWIRSATIGIRLSMHAIPIFDGLNNLVLQGCVPGGTYSNAAFSVGVIQGNESITAAEWLVLNDPQTSGGLCLAVDPMYVNTFVSNMKEAGLDIWMIGEVTDTDRGKITLIR
jgi:selenide,water dikinase